MFITGLYFTSATIASLFSPVAIVATAIISVCVGNERTSVLKFIGIFVAVCGALFTVIALSVSKSEFSSTGFTFSITGLVGSVCLTINVIAYGVYVNLQMWSMSKRGIPPLTVSTWSCIFGFIFTSLISIPFIPMCDFANSTWQAWYGVVYAGTFGASCSWTLNTIASKYVKPTLMTIHGTALPVWTAVLSYFLLGDVIPWYAALGAVLIVAGVIFVAVAKFRESKTRENKLNSISDTELEDKKSKEINS
jgi:drug/metabolite transporter (DMT)-like permease